MGDLVVAAASQDAAFIGWLVMALYVLLFVFFVYIFPFFVYFITGTSMHGTMKVLALFTLSIIITLCLAFFAAYTVSFNYILSAISSGFIFFTITGFSLITGYSVFDQKYPKNHKWMPYILSSIVCGGYMLYSFGFPIANPFNVESFFTAGSAGVKSAFEIAYSSAGFFPEYAGNFLLWLSYFEYYIEILILGIIFCALTAFVAGKIAGED